MSRAGVAPLLLPPADKHLTLTILPAKGVSMRDRTKMDYSKLLGFDLVPEEIVDGVDFKDATVGAKLGAKVGKKMTIETTDFPLYSKDLPEIVQRAAEPIMRGLGGRTVSDS
jgi:hypothetical protein